MGSRCSWSAVWPWTSQCPSLNPGFLFYKTASQERKRGRSRGLRRVPLGCQPKLWETEEAAVRTLWVKKPQEAGTGPGLLPQGPWRNHITATAASTVPRRFPLPPVPGRHLLPTAGRPLLQHLPWVAAPGSSCRRGCCPCSWGGWPGFKEPASPLRWAAPALELQAQFQPYPL